MFLSRRASVSFSIASLACVASSLFATAVLAADPELMRIEIILSNATEFKGDFRVFNGKTEVPHGIDAAWIAGGDGEVTSGSDKQTNFRGNCRTIKVQFRVKPENRDRIEVNTSVPAKIKVFVDNAERQSVDKPEGTTIIIIQ